MEWLIAHEEELNDDTSLKRPAAEGANKSSPVLETTSQPPDSAAKMAAKQAEQRQSEADSAGKAESDKEAADMAKKKSISLQEAEKLIEERRIKRLEEEKKKAIEDEKARRISGQKMAETRAELEATERVRIAQQIRQEKKEKELHRKMILEQIARDREARKVRDDASEVKQMEQTKPPAGSSKPSPSSATTPGANHTECRLALRFPDGTSIVQKFSAKEQLASVRLFVLLKCNQSADLSPNKHLEFYIPPNVKLSEESMEKTLESLGLCPSSRLIVQFKPNASQP